jgi:hypothetical protein
VTTRNVERGMWGDVLYIDMKSKDRLYESWNGSMGMETKECSGIACREGSHCIE